MSAFEWKPHPGPQTMALRRKEKEILYGGARGGGKTEAGIAWLIEPEYINNPKYRALVIRRNAEDLSAWIDRATRFYAPFGAKKRGIPVEFQWPSGAVIKTGHLKDRDAYTKYLGHEYHKILIEELTLIESEENYLKLKSACRSTDPSLRPQLFMTTNPGGVGHHWVKKRFIDPAPPFVPFKGDDGEWRIFIKATVEDNPTLCENDPGYLRFLDSLDENLKKAWRDGDWNIFEGRFFSEWNTEHHIVPSDMNLIDPESCLIRGIDYGFAAPFCCLWLAVLPPPRKRIYVYRELYKERLYDYQQAQIVSEMSAGERYVDTLADPACWTSRSETGLSISQVWEENGLYATKAMNNRISGWARVRAAMKMTDDYDGRPVLQVFDCCENLIRTIPSLSVSDVNIEDLDTRQEDHAADALRYALTSRTFSWLGEMRRRPERPPFKTREETIEEEIRNLDRKRNARECLWGGLPW